MSDREDRAQALAAVNATSTPWAHMTPTQKDKYRKQAEREGYSSEVSDGSSDRTNASAYVETAMRGRLDDLEILTKTVDGYGEGYFSPDQLEAVGIEEKHATEDDGRAAEEAEERLNEYPLCVETTICFEVVFGTGGPDDRLIVECDVITDRAYGTVQADSGLATYEIRRILYRYSWSGSAERVLSGDDYDVAERFARSVVSELADA